MTNKSVKVIFDTNVWISFLIGKKLAIIKDYISNGSIKIIITAQLITELKEVTNRDKLKKYFPRKSVNELIALLSVIAENYQIKPNHGISRDPKDDFLLDLIEVSSAHFLVIGDKDLLELNPFNTTQIVTPS